MGGIRSALLVLTSVLTTLALVAAVLPATVSAAPSTSVDLALTGAGQTITLPGRTAETGLRLPVPDGLTPVSIRGRVSTPAYVTRGSVDVKQGDRLLTRITLPAASPADLTIPLTGLRVDRQSRSAAIVVSTHLDTDGFCSDDPTDGVVVTDAQVMYDGDETLPDTVGSFLPPVMTSLTITVPDDVQPVEASAGVGLATAVAARYGSAPVSITTVTRPRDDLRAERGGPLSRHIVIGTNLPSGLHIASGGALTIGGPAPDLAAQAGFLTSDLSPLAMSPGVIAGQLYDAPQLARDVTTLADLGVPDQRATTDGWPRLVVGIDQTRMARPSHNVRVQLRGTFTPPRGDGGRIVVAVGDRVLDSVPTDATGVFNRWVAIPDDVLARYTELTVTAEYGGARTACGQADRATLTLASDGQIDADAADPPTPSGLQSLPQALMPRVQLAWTRGDAADLSRAVDILTHLQQLTSVRLGVDVVSVADAASSTHPAVVIGADGTGLPADLALPLTSKDGRLTVRDSVTGTDRVFTPDPAVRYGSLQVARDNGRSVLVASSVGNAAALDDLLGWLGRDGHWSSAAGDAIVTTVGAEPVMIASTATPARAEESGSGWTYAVIALIGAAALALLLLVVRRRRK